MIATFTKDPSENLDYTITWADWLAAGETIVTSTWVVPTGVVGGATSSTTTTATTWISGGVDGTTYEITNHVVTSAGRVGDRSFYLTVTDRFITVAGVVTTARTIITRSLKLIGALAEGETPTAEAANDALATLNDLIAGWQAEQVPVHTLTRATLALVSGQASYTIGDGGDFNRAWPYTVPRASFLTASTPVTETPLQVLYEQEWQDLSTKTLTSTTPVAIYYNPTYPLGRLHVYPVATDATATLVIYVHEPVATLATLDTVLSLPPGYQKMIRYNLALELAPEYGRTPDPQIRLIAQQTLGAIKRTNFRPALLRVDAALLAGGGGGRYNIRTDTGG
jgi:hypothetical protein